MDSTTETVIVGGNAGPPQPPVIAASTLVYTFVVLTLIICVLTAVGNLLILIALRVDSKLLLQSGQLVQSLAITDLLVGVATLIDHCILLNKLAQDELTPPDQNVFEYKGFNEIIAESAVFSSMFHVLLIAFDRLLSIVKPLRYPTLVTDQRLYIAISVAYICSLACGVSFWAVETKMGVIHKMQVRPAAQLFMFYLTLFVLCLCYGNMVVMAVRLRRKVQIETPAAPSGATPTPSASSKRSRVLFTVIGLFVLLWIPQVVFNILRLLEATPPDPTAFAVLANLAKTLVMANSGVNIFVYCLLNRHFRTTLMAMVRGKHPPEHGSSIQDSSVANRAATNE